MQGTTLSRSMLLTLLPNREAFLAVDTAEVDLSLAVPTMVFQQAEQLLETRAMFREDPVQVLVPVDRVDVPLLVAWHRINHGRHSRLQDTVAVP